MHTTAMTAKLKPTRDDLFGPDRLCDPSFEACRDESCPREGLHAAHEVVMGNRASRNLDVCPRCQSPVVVTHGKRKKAGGKRHRQTITAKCPECDWTFTNEIKKRTPSVCG